MKTLETFVVEIPATTQDTLKTDSGLELYVDTKYNEFDHRTTEAEIISCPLRYKTGAKSGDTLYFHHHVVINGGSPLVEEDNHYIVMYSDKHVTQNQAIAYKNKKDGVVRPLFGWALLEPIEEVDEKPSELIEVVSFKEKEVTQGVVSFDTKELKEVGVSKGDTVGFKINRDYRIKIDGKEYYRVAVSELLYKV